MYVCKRVLAADLGKSSHCGMYFFFKVIFCGSTLSFQFRQINVCLIFQFFFIKYTGTVFFHCLWLKPLFDLSIFRKYYHDLGTGSEFIDSCYGMVFINVNFLHHLVWMLLPIYKAKILTWLGWMLRTSWTYKLSNISLGIWSLGRASLDGKGK